MIKKRQFTFLFFISLSASYAAVNINSGIYSIEQAKNGQFLYNSECSSCHGLDLEGSEIGSNLAGLTFRKRWHNSSIKKLFLETKSTMPTTNPGSLSDEQYSNLIAYILYKNSYSPGPLLLNASNNNAEEIKFTAPKSIIKENLIQEELTSGITNEWLHHRGQPQSTNYSELDIINKENVGDLKIAWRWKSENFGPKPWPNLQTTPIMANDTLYATAGGRRTVVAIDAKTGETLWIYRIDEGERGENAPRKGPGRGVAFARIDNKGIIYLITPGYQLIALDAENGLPIDSFGINGIVDLKANLDQDIDLVKTKIGSSSPPIIINDVIVVGSAFSAGAAPPKKEMPIGSVTGYDVRTGKRLWIFHTIPQADEYGNETWKNNSWEYTGNAGVWTPMSADPELGYIYLPVEAPTGDYYGGHRLGDNLFGQSLVCLDAKTGKRIWHFQTIHHPLWDYDLPAPPVLLDIEVNGKKIPSVAQITKQGFTFVFDRRNGDPVWPIIEKSVPQSTVPGEISAQTQPIPVLPEIFESQGVTIDNLNNLTPEIFDEAVRIASQYTLGPIYTPPTLVTDTNKGTLVAPGSVGGANWQSAAADPETGLLYVSSTATAAVYGLLTDNQRSNMDYIAGGDSVEGPFGLPLLRPPWGRITAINLNTGKIQWVIPNGDTPSSIINHKKLKGIKLPRTGHDDRAGLLVTKSLLFAGEGSGLYTSAGLGGTKFRAHDKLTGKIISELDLGLRQTGVPMTYAINGKQYIIVASGAPKKAGELIALTVEP